MKKNGQTFVEAVDNHKTQHENNNFDHCEIKRYSQADLHTKDVGTNWSVDE